MVTNGGGTATVTITGGTKVRKKDSSTLPAALPTYLLLLHYPPLLRILPLISTTTCGRVGTMKGRTAANHI